MRNRANLATKNPDFQKFALEFGSTTEVDNWIRAHFRYRDETEEILRTPEFMLNDALVRLGYLEGDCDDISTFTAAFFKTLGLSTRFVAIRYTPDNPNFEHVFTQAHHEASGWQTFDATVPPGTDIRAVETLMMEV
jgi:transglutaminase-like putative cysteine protease